MMRRAVYALLAISVVAELGACKNLLKKKDPDPAPSAIPVVVAPPPVVIAPTIPEATASAAPVAAAPPTVDEGAIPTPQDFEDEAFEKVTPANFKAQFATLKASIAKK